MARELRRVGHLKFICTDTFGSRVYGDDRIPTHAVSYGMWLRGDVKDCQIWKALVKALPPAKNGFRCTITTKPPYGNEEGFTAIKVWF